VESARSTDKCLRTANNEGAGSGVRDVLTFLHIDVFPRQRVRAERNVPNDECSGKTLRVSERHL